MADLANLPNFQPAPRTYSAAELNALFEAITIAVGAVTLAKLQALTTNSLIGRGTAGTGAAELIPCTAAGRALLAAATAAEQRTALEIVAAGGGGLTRRLTANVVTPGTSVATLTQLNLPLAAASEYALRGCFFIGQNAGGSGAKLSIDKLSPLTIGNSFFEIDWSFQANPTATQKVQGTVGNAVYGSNTSAPVMMAKVTGFVRTVLAGDLIVRGGQYNSGDTTTYGEGCWMEAVKLA